MGDDVCVERTRYRPPARFFARCVGASAHTRFPPSGLVAEQSSSRGWAAPTGSRWRPKAARWRPVAGDCGRWRPVAVDCGRWWPVAVDCGRWRPVQAGVAAAQTGCKRARENAFPARRAPPPLAFLRRQRVWFRTVGELAHGLEVRRRARPLSLPPPLSLPLTHPPSLLPALSPSFPPPLPRSLPPLSLSLSLRLSLSPSLSISLSLSLSLSRASSPFAFEAERTEPPSQEPRRADGGPVAASLSLPNRASITSASAGRRRPGGGLSLSP
jgi:hypothetical protein